MKKTAKKMTVLGLMLASLSLAACVYTHPRHPHDGDFCPPGQAKKGNC